MADETKKLFQARAAGDVKVLKDAFSGNGALTGLLASLNGLKGAGFSIDVSNLVTHAPSQSAQAYVPPTVSQGVTLRAPGKGEASMVVTLDVGGVYRFEAASKSGMAAGTYGDTTVGNQAANRFQQWLVDVQSAFDINVLGTALARASERAQASKAAAENRDPAAKPA